MTESISTGKLSSAKNPSSPGSSINAEQTAARMAAASSHPEPHKSREARTASLALTQPRRARQTRRRGGKLRVEGREEKEDKKRVSQ